MDEKLTFLNDLWHFCTRDAQKVLTEPALGILADAAVPNPPRFPCCLADLARPDIQVAKYIHESVTSDLHLR